MSIQKWLDFKKQTEIQWHDKYLYEGVSGFQIQAETQWCKGLETNEIVELESQFGFNFPNDYKTMLSVINGFDCDNIDIYEEQALFRKTCYTYPEDLALVSDFLNELWLEKDAISSLLSKHGYNGETICGFVPLYAH